MATYTCDTCNMSVNATCGHCDAPLQNDNLSLSNGQEEQISKIPKVSGRSSRLRVVAQT